MKKIEMNIVANLEPRYVTKLIDCAKLMDMTIEGMVGCMIKYCIIFVANKEKIKKLRIEK